MFIIDCLPLSKGLNKESLTYFSSNFLEPGSLIKVSVRNRQESAIVIQSRDLHEAKSEVKSANFQLKKVLEFKAKPFLQKEFLIAVKETADYFATREGMVLSHLIPSFVLENPSLLSTFKETNTEFKKERYQEPVVILQNTMNERFAHYKALIREEFAKQRSVFICLPQNEDIKEARAILEKGIESYVVAFHKNLNKKEWKEEWKRASLSKHPVLIIATPRMLFIPRPDLGLIIIDRENENGWKTISKPFIDLRFFTEMLARQKGLRLILGDSFLRIETLWRYNQKEIGEFERTKWKNGEVVKTAVVDMREINKKQKEFKTLSPEIYQLLQEVSEKGAQIFLFTVRKGLASNTICRDCGETVKCNNCTSPMVLYKLKNDAIFKCHQCGESRSAAEYCQNCKSWKLAAYGSGIDKVVEEIKTEFPDLGVFEIHKDLTSTHTKAENVIGKFLDTRGSVLVGTEMAFSYLTKKVFATAIVSFDSLFSIPDFRIKEKIFHIIVETKGLAREKFLIQTRNPEDPTVISALKGDLSEFYEKEIADRRSLNYPPHGTFIKVTVRGTKSLVQKEELFLKELLKDYKPTIFHSMYEKQGEQLAVNAVIKLPKEDWPDPNLLLLLKNESNHFEVKIDPDNLL